MKAKMLADGRLVVMVEVRPGDPDYERWASLVADQPQQSPAAAPPVAERPWLPVPDAVAAALRDRRKEPSEDD
jgi:hypothetical protein